MNAETMPGDDLAAGAAAHVAAADVRLPFEFVGGAGVVRPWRRADRASPFVMARYGLARLTSYANPRNLGSIHVLEGAGFVREGLIRARAIRDGVAHDHVAFGLVDPARLPAG